jgi:catechol 2,3-dioxygenase-like lactoylglutathione lyase family enzyme
MKLPTLPSTTRASSAARAEVAAIHLRTADLDRTCRFFGDLLGLALVRTEPAPRRRAFFAAGATWLILEESPEAPAANGPVMQLGLAVPSLDFLEALRRHLLGAGVPTSGIENLGYGFAFRFRDPSTGLFLQAQAVTRPFTDDDRWLDPEPPAAIRDLLGPRPAGSA